MDFAIGIAVGGWFMHFVSKGKGSAAYATGFTIGAVIVVAMDLSGWWPQ